MPFGSAYDLAIEHTHTGAQEKQMVRNSKQAWEIGETVKVGFMSLRVVEKEPTPGDYMPDAYILVGLGKNEDRRYRFVPHNGLERLQ